MLPTIERNIHPSDSSRRILLKTNVKTCRQKPGFRGRESVVIIRIHHEIRLKAEKLGSECGLMSFAHLFLEFAVKFSNFIIIAVADKNTVKCLVGFSFLSLFICLFVFFV